MHRISSCSLHFSLQPLLDDFVGELVDTVHVAVKQTVGFHA
jgi:hypothetical protein